MNLKWLAPFLAFLIVFIFPGLSGVICSDSQDSDLFYLLIDTSGSLHDWISPTGVAGKGTDPDDLRVTAARILVDLLYDTDCVGISMFATESKIIHPVAELTVENRKSLKDALRQTKVATGFTNINSALIEAKDQLEKWNGTGSKYVVLFSDGIPSKSWYDDPATTQSLMDEALGNATYLASRGISLYCIALSPDPSMEQFRSFMREIAEISVDHTGKGGFELVVSPQDLNQAFLDIFWSVKRQALTEIQSDRAKITIGPYTDRLSILFTRENSQNKSTVINPKAEKVEPTAFDEYYELYSFSTTAQDLKGEWEVLRPQASSASYWILQDLNFNISLTQPEADSNLIKGGKPSELYAELSAKNGKTILDPADFQVDFWVLESTDLQAQSTINPIQGELKSESSQSLIYQARWTPPPDFNLNRCYLMAVASLSPQYEILLKSQPVPVNLFPRPVVNLTLSGENGQPVSSFNIKLKPDQEKSSFEYTVRLQATSKLASPVKIELSENLRSSLKISGPNQFSPTEELASYKIVLQTTRSLPPGERLEGTIKFVPLDEDTEVKPSSFSLYYHHESKWDQVWAFLKIFFVIFAAAILLGLGIWFYFWRQKPAPSGRILQIKENVPLRSNSDGTVSILREEDIKRRFNLRERKLLSRLFHPNYITFGPKGADFFIPELRNKLFKIEAVIYQEGRRRKIGVRPVGQRGMTVARRGIHLVLLDGEVFEVRNDSGASPPIFWVYKS
uniref:VWA domain-containing protein n=1 Tax=candidate division WOR-3 bacterium TaxID=2052148 RepID=A0A7V3NTP0_UNCW3